MRELLRPFRACRLCWRITAAVFLLILAVEAAILLPSARQFEANERQQLADHAQIVIEPLLARAAPPDAALGRYGILGVSVFGPGGARTASAGAAPGPVAAVPAMAQALADYSAETLLAAWKSEALPGHAVVVRADASGVVDRVRAYVLRIGGLVLIIVTVVTVGTMLVLDLAVLRPLLRLRESSMRAGRHPGEAAQAKLRTRRRDEIGDLVAAHNAMLEQVAENARRLSHFDALSGLPNRRALIEHLDGEREQAATLLLVNVVQFRAVNAGFGASAGDRVIRALAARLRAAAAPGDFPAHLGADRLALAVPGLRAPDEAAALAERLLARLAAPFDLGGGDSVSPRVRIGIAQSAQGVDGTTLLAQADLALSRTYAEEAAYQFFSPPLAAEARARQALARDLERALERGELYAVFQPKFTLAGAQAGRLCGAEVLVRWAHPSRGMVSPAQFVPIAETSGLIVSLGEFILRAACAQLGQWLARHGASPRLAVNLSAQQFAQPDIVAHVERAAREAGVPADLLELEITETAAMRDVARTSATLAEMRALGLHVSIDDFGTGYSSLNYLRRFAVDAIKIDKSFVDDIGRDAHAETICDAILRLGRALGTRVIAEGVESEAQAAFLRERHCDEAQGYLYGKPVPAAEFERRYLSARVAA